MKKYILFLVTVALLSSCFDLDHEEFGSISSTNFPSSSADLEAAVTLQFWHFATSTSNDKNRHDKVWDRHIHDKIKRR